jgi:hypothetical protein
MLSRNRHGTKFGPMARKGMARSLRLGSSSLCLTDAPALLTIALYCVAKVAVTDPRLSAVGSG